MDEGEVLHVSVSSSRQYRIGEFGRAALTRLLDPEYRVSIRDLRSGDRVTLTVMWENVTAVRIDMPSGFFDQVD